MSKYLEFDYVGDSPTGKTEVWNVLSKSKGKGWGHIVGQIRWHGAWRQYSFYPSHGCAFNNECMSDIQNKITDLMIKHKT